MTNFSDNDDKNFFDNDFAEIAGEELEAIIERLQNNINFEYIERAEKFLKENKDGEALEEYEKALKENPEDPIVYQCIGNFYADRKDYPEAIDNYKKALEIESALPFTHNNLGLIYAKTGNFEGAVEEFKAAVEMAPKEASLLNNLANTFARAGSFEEASRYFKKALEIEPHNIKYKFNLALSLQKNGSPDSLEIYKDILNREPENKKALEALIHIYREEKKYDEALLFLESILLKKSSEGLFYEKGKILQETGKYEEAFCAFEKALSLENSPRNLSAFELLGFSCIKKEINRPVVSEKVYSVLIEKEEARKEFYNNLGISLRKQGKIKEALEIYKKGIKIAPGWPEIRQSAGNVYADLGDFPGALKEFQKAIELSPNDAWIYGKAGHICQLTGEYDKAIEYFEKSLKLDPGLADACISLGIAYYYKSDLEKAESNLYRATLLDPLKVKGHICWVEVLVQQKNLKKALDRYEPELKKSPEYPLIHYMVGLTSFYRYQLPRAEKSVNQAIKLNPAFKDAYSLKGSIYYEYKKIDDAISCYEKAFSLDPDESWYEYVIAYCKRVKGETSTSLFEKIYRNAPGSILGKCAKAFLLMDEGKLKEATEILKEAISLDPLESEPYFILGMVYEKLGEDEKAKGSYEKAYKENPIDFDAKRALDRLS